MNRSDRGTETRRNAPADAALVRSAAQGDVEAFADLVRLYTNAACAVAYGVLRDYHLAQDVAQETFVKAFRSLRSLQQPERFGSWLYAIATNLSIDYKRALSRNTRTNGELHAAAASEPSADAEAMMLQRELRHDVEQALGQLDDTSRAITIGYYIGGMKMPDIARMLDMTVPAVESRLRRSRKQLKETHLAAWADRFVSRPASDKLVIRVVERIVKQAGQHYIPVSDRSRMTEWFVRCFGLSLDRNGHVLLPSGHCLFLIEVGEAVLAERVSSPLPAAVFGIEDEERFCLAMAERGVRTAREADPATGRTRVFFFDPDGNRYGAYPL